MSKKDQILERIIQFAKAKHLNADIYLFGSRARGDSKNLSDWDLLILLNLKNVPFELETKIMDDFYELELETGEVISPLIYSKNDWNKRYSSTPLFETIKMEGIKIK